MQIKWDDTFHRYRFFGAIFWNIANQNIVLPADEDYIR